MPNIKQIKIGDQIYDINAIKLEGHSYQDILDLVSTGFTIEVPWTSAMAASKDAPSAAQLAKIPEGIEVVSVGGKGVGTLTADSADAKKHLYLVYHNHKAGDTFDEYVSTGSAWEKIGNTDIDLSNYVTYGKTFTTTSNGEGKTGAAGAATITTSKSGAQTASGSVSLTYQKANASTGESGGQTITPTFTGTAATITLSGSVSGTAVGDHEYTPEGSISGSQDIAGHSHTISVATPTTASVVTGVSSTTTTAIASVTGNKSSALNSATVSEDGVLSFNSADFVSSVSSTNATVLASAKASGTTNAITALGEITAASAGSTKVDFSKAVFAGVAATLSHSVTQGKASVSGSFTPKGTISDVVIAAHSHAIGSASTTITGDVSVDIADHTHTVTIADHTHSIANHTHNVTLSK